MVARGSKGGKTKGAGIGKRRHGGRTAAGRAAAEHQIQEAATPAAGYACEDYDEVLSAANSMSPGEGGGVGSTRGSDLGYPPSGSTASSEAPPLADIHTTPTGAMLRHKMAAKKSTPGFFLIDERPNKAFGGLYPKVKKKMISVYGKDESRDKNKNDIGRARWAGWVVVSTPDGRGDSHEHRWWPPQATDPGEHWQRTSQLTSALPFLTHIDTFTCPPLSSLAPHPRLSSLALAHLRRGQGEHRCERQESVRHGKGSDVQPVHPVDRGEGEMRRWPRLRRPLIARCLFGSRGELSCRAELELAVR